MEEPIRAFAYLDGFEELVVDELRTLAPASEVASRRPGLLLVRDPGVDARLSVVEPLHPAFARAEFAVWGEVVPKSPRAAADALAGAIVESLEEGGEPPALHVFAQGAEGRDALDEEVRALERGLRRALGGRVRSKIAAGPGDEVLDVVRLAGGATVFGAHVRGRADSAFPGGRRRLAARDDAPSRAHLKLEEGLEWSALEIAPDDVALDVGCAPGGWSLILLERGLRVHGADPTPVAPAVSGHPRFVAHEGPVRTFDPSRAPGLKWVFCDMNGPPFDALGQLEHVLARAPAVRGVFHTVKLSDDPPLRVLAETRSRIAAAGFPDVLVRHLYHNRSELTLVARRGRA